MTTLASLRILLGLESGGVKTGANSVRSDLKAVQAEANNTNATLRNIGKGVQAGFGLGAGLGAFQLTKRAVGELTDFVKDSVQASIEEEAGIKRLGQSLEANVPAWDGNTTAIEANIASQEALGFSDGDLRDSLAKLSGATHDVGKSFEIQALAMDLARFKNIDLASATDELIKVQAGSFRSLKALGIELKAGASATEAFGLIQKVVAGQAVAFGETTAGATAAAGIAVQNLQEDIGVGLAPIVRDLAVSIRRDVIPALRDMGAGLNDVGALAGPVIELLKIMSHNTDELAAHAKEQGKADAIAAIGAQAATAAYAAYNDAQRALGDSLLHGTISQQQYNDQSKVLSETFVRLAGNTDGFASSAQDLAPHLLAVAGALNQADDNAAGYVASATQAAVSTDGLSAAQMAVAQATIDAGRAHKELADAQTVAATAAVGDMGAVVDLARAQAADKLATDQLKAALDALTTAMPVAASEAHHIAEEMLGLHHQLTDVEIAANLADAALSNMLRARGAVPRLIGDIPLGTTTGTPGEGTIAALQAQQSAADATAARERDRLAKAKSDADDAASAAKRNAADIAAAYHDKLGKAFDDVADRAHAAFAKIHDENLKAIDDVRNLANAALDEQERAIRGSVDAARAQVQAMRDARHLGDLRGAVAGAQTPEELASANRALNDFLTDQRLAVLSANADTQIAAIEAEKTKNDTVAALAIAAENQRSKDQAAALDKDLAKLKDHLAAYTGEWRKAFADIAAAAKKYHLSDLVGINAPATGAPPKVGTGTVTGTAAASVAAGLAPAGDQIIHVIVNVGDEQVADYIDRHLAKKSSRASSGGIAG